MNMSSYEKIKDFIYKKLQEVDGALPNGKIISEIENTKSLIIAIGVDMFAKVLSTDSLSELSANDWDRMQREFETLFDVKMEPGILIQGEEQRRRDTIWWTSKGKQKSENYYWNRYEKYIRKSLPFEVVKTIDVDTDRIMNNIENPEVDDFSTYGMVVGHVQSGKTGNYSALICKAADAGYKFIVVIAGGINTLRDQTQDRLNKSFVGEDMRVSVGVGKLGGNKKKKVPMSLTTRFEDFNKRDANKNKQSTNFDTTNSPIILVIKKHSGTLDNVISWLGKDNKQKNANHAMLVIDDESDYASINTKAENDPTIINEKIRTLLCMFKKSAYVAYTATPYANIFIDHQVNHEEFGKDLFPKDFIYALETPSNYFGAEKIFLDPDFKHIVKIKEPENLKLSHKKYEDVKYIPDSLKEAIRLFIINIGIRCLRKQKSKHNSMLIHATRFTMVHQKISYYINEYVSLLRKDILSYALLNNAETQSKNIKEIKETFELRCNDVEFSWKKVLKSISNIIGTVVIREVHQSKSVELEYRDDSVTNAIVIGGTSLSRGYTLEGLSISYFLRSTIFYDTLMQMGRWFGYRENYEDLCKIYMTESMRDNFKLIIEATEDLFYEFRRMEKEKKTPEDFGLAVRTHPDSVLQVTARNKQKNTEEIYVEMNLDGTAKETSWIIDDINIREKNMQAIKNIIDTLDNEYKQNKDSEIKKSHLWKNVNKNVVGKFLNEFEVYRNDQLGISSRMPIIFIKKYVNEKAKDWDVALYSLQEGEENYSITNNIKIKKENRKVIQRNGYYEIEHRQVSSGDAESISLSKDERKELGSNRREIRQRLERPLLMLHILDIEGVDPQLAAFGISFPGRSKEKSEAMRINTVYIEELKKLEELLKEELLKQEDYDD